MSPKDNSTDMLYQPGTRCWYPDKENGWIGGEILSKNFDKASNTYNLELKLEDGSVIKVESNTLTENDLTDFSDSDVQKAISEATNGKSSSFLPLLRNPPILESTEDLTSLSYLNEPAVLHAIKARYSQLNIYSYSGIVLIAANPFDKVDELYSRDMIQAYAGRRRGELEPHLFAIAEEAYSMMKNEGKNQTIVVSGESGAGKTVSAKYIMRYFASVEEIHKNGTNIASENESDSEDDKISDTEKKILATNPIMEAFGNAKTTRNDNSSRFGKYLEILFDDNTSIIGAKIRTYLLERSRLVFQPENERNYHIFYQMLKGLTDEQKEEFSLKDIGDYKYLNQGGSYEIDNVDDKKEYQITCDALSLVGIDEEKQHKIFQTLSALLHIGNIEITKTRNDASLSSEEPNLQIACKLLGLDPVLFAKWICKKQITTRSEKIISNLSFEQAIVARDSVAKFIYSALFDWLVENINVTLCNPEIEHKVKNFIGVLDIYGFEHFKKNSFEQFCINYANEKLQQEFNQHVFKLEQEEYVKEKIEWSFIEFNDNQPCIDLIENKVGILSLLDEESRLPAGNDKSWSSKLIDTLDKPPTDKTFKKPRFGQDKFIVKHYALDVEYDSEGFIEKNRDTVSEGHLEVLKKSESDILKELLTVIDERAAALEAKEQEQLASGAVKKSVGKIGQKKKPTLGSIFKNSLVELMETINSTNVHYIRCIKPNDAKAAWNFDNLMVLSQLRACGVLETIRISCAGFPTRWTYDEFVSRYHILAPSEHWSKLYNSQDLKKEDIRELTEKVLSLTNTDDSKFQLGLNKIFFKSGMLAHLEKLRNDKQQQAIIQIQKKIKGKFWRKWYLEVTGSIRDLTSVLKGEYTRKVVDTEFKTELAVDIQKVIKAFKIRKDTNQIISSVIRIQSVLRMLEHQKQFAIQRDNNAATALQKKIRALKPRREFLHKKKSTVVVQSLIRRKFAKAKLSSLKTEAESVNNLKEVSYQLENKVIELSESLAVKIKENKELNVRISELQESLSSNVNLQEALKLENENSKKSIEELNAEHSDSVKSYEEKLQLAKANMESVLVEVEEIKQAKEELKKDIKEKLEELTKTREQLSNTDTLNTDLQNEVTSLKSEIQRLQAALASGAALSSAAVINSGPSDFVAGGNRSIIASPVKHELQSSPVHKRYSHISQQGVLDSPGSLISGMNDEMNFGMGDDRSISAIMNDINDELYNLFNDTGPLISEIVAGLLSNFKTPETSTSVNLSRKEVLYPARILIIILSDMWRLGLTKQSENFLAEVLSTIQKIVSGIKGADLIPGGAFWLTNVRELYSFVVYAEKTILHDDSYIDGIDDAEFKEYLKLIADLRDDFEALSYNVYNLWVKKLEKDLEKKIVPAVVLSQSLPGFVSSENNNLLPKFFNSGSPTYKMDDILTSLNNIYWSLKNYHVEAEIFTSITTTLLKFIDAVAFNDIIMRKNFLSWKRGLQLHYNVTRLEEWCKGHHIAVGPDCLKHIMQVAKLLQIKKATVEDIDIVFEVCSALKPVQIQKLLTLYAIADYETPFPENISKYLAQKVKNSGEEENSGSKASNKPVFLPSNSGPFKDPYATLPTREFGKIEAYIPTWLNLPITKQIVKLVTEHVQYQENGDILDQGGI